MTFFFIGGEDHDFTKIGNCSVDTTTTAARRTVNSRCSLKIGNSASTSDGWVGALSSPQSSFWLTGRVYMTATNGGGCELISLKDAAGVRRITIGLNSTVPAGLQITTRNAAGTQTQLAFVSGNLATSTLIKVDIFVNYAAAGLVQVYLDGSLYISYSGNLLTDSATTLSSFTLGLQQGSANTYWSEVICADADTRFMDLITLAPAANGNTFNFDAGSVSSINEVTLDDATVITSSTVGQVAQFTVGSTGVTGSKAIKAVCISARAGKGATGPQTAKMNVRTGSTDYSTSSIALQAGSVARIQGVFATNPGTGNAWTNAELTAAGFNIGIVSDT